MQALNNLPAPVLRLWWRYVPQRVRDLVPRPMFQRRHVDLSDIPVARVMPSSIAVMPHDRPTADEARADLRAVFSALDVIGRVEFGEVAIDLVTPPEIPVEPAEEPPANEWEVINR